MNWYLAMKTSCDNSRLVEAGWWNANRKKLNNVLAPAVWMANAGLAGGAAELALNHKSPPPQPPAQVQPHTAPATQTSNSRQYLPTKPSQTPAPPRSGADVHRLRNHLTFDESSKVRAYGDPIHDKGVTDPMKWKVPTMGIGHAVDLRKDPKHIDPALQNVVGDNYWDVVHGKKDLSDNEIGSLFDKDVDRSMHGVKELAKANGISEQQFDALPPVVQETLVNMGFQMGTASPKHGLGQFHKMWHAIGQQHWPEVAQYMMQSRWAHQTPNRAYRLIRQMAHDLGFQPPPPPKGYDPKKHDYPS